MGFVDKLQRRGQRFMSALSKAFPEYKVLGFSRGMLSSRPGYLRIWANLKVLEGTILNRETEVAELDVFTEVP